MDNTQIIRMLNTRIYRDLPVSRGPKRGVSFKPLMRRLINYIDRRRLRRYMVLKINQALDLADNYEDVEDESADADADADADDDAINQKMCTIYDEFSKEEQRWIDCFCSIVDEATVDQRFVMLNLLRILDLGPGPDEALLIAKDKNANAINNMNDVLA